MRTSTTLLAAALGLASLGAAACDDDKEPAASSASPAAASPSGSSAPASPGTPAPSALPSGIRTKDPKVTGSEIIMIDPSGKKYTRKTMIEMAAGMAAVSGRLPSDFCPRSYKSGIDGGGSFPAGKQAFMEACQAGVRLAH
ncbi:hypothetical protein [Actinomadura fibrosa]|uniref:Lipoprotein n=1 Tax=Actinomadura fibrosa TaxID=111802 RepID=A0ABW2XQY4_9ACTN|nr:hypothetical protein [Actinomadura fibrosa]